MLYCERLLSFSIYCLLLALLVFWWQFPKKKKNIHPLARTHMQCFQYCSCAKWIAVFEHCHFGVCMNCFPNGRNRIKIVVASIEILRYVLNLFCVFRKFRARKKPTFARNSTFKVVCHRFGGGSFAAAAVAVIFFQKLIYVLLCTTFIVNQNFGIFEGSKENLSNFRVLFFIVFVHHTSCACVCIHNFVQSRLQNFPNQSKDFNSFGFMNVVCSYHQCQNKTYISHKVYFTWLYSSMDPMMIWTKSGEDISLARL